MRSNCPATTELFGTNQSTHNTVGWSSLNRATCSPDFTLYTSSITSHSNKSPAISKSEFVSVPMRLEFEIISLFTHFGHCMQNTVGVHGKILPKTTPPITWPDTYFIPMQSAHPLISYLHLVGLRVGSRSSVFVSLIALRSFGFWWRNTNSSSRASI